MSNTLAPPAPPAVNPPTAAPTPSAPLSTQQGSGGMVALAVIAAAVVYVASTPLATAFAVVVAVVWAVRGIVGDRRARAAGQIEGAPALSQRAASALRARLPGHAGAPGAANVALDALAAIVGFAVGSGLCVGRDFVSGLRGIARGARRLAERGRHTPPPAAPSDSVRPTPDAANRPSGPDATGPANPGGTVHAPDETAGRAADYWDGELVDGELVDGAGTPRHTASRPGGDVTDAVIVEPRALDPARPALPASSTGTDLTMSDVLPASLPAAEHTIFDVMRFAGTEAAAADQHHADAAQQAQVAITELERIRARAIALVQRAQSLAGECSGVDAALQRSAVVVGAWRWALEVAQAASADQHTVTAIGLAVEAAGEVQSAQQARRDLLAAAAQFAAAAARAQQEMAAQIEAAVVSYRAEMAAAEAYREAVIAVRAALHSHQVPHAQAQAATGNAAAAPGYLAGA